MSHNFISQLGLTYGLVNSPLLLKILSVRDEVAGTQQEAQLPLRNRASAMHFFVAKLLSITYSSTAAATNHLRTLRPMIQLICYHTANTSMRRRCDGKQVA